ncbi:MAG: NAD(P)/FAD-dependent oxidoreductase [bacterium]
MRTHEKSVKKIEAKLQRAGMDGLTVQASRDSFRLAGTVDCWDDKVRAGHIAAEFCGASVLNEIKVNGIDEPDHPDVPVLRDDLVEGRSFDVVIIGGGVIGCAVARELSRYELSIAVMEKECDLAMHASGRNDGMIHPGFAPQPGSKKAAYNVRGNRMYDRLCRELNVDFDRPGSLVLFSKGWYKLLLPLFLRRAKKNGVEGARFLSKRRVAELEPWITKQQHGALFFPTAGRLSPYKLTIALAENAAENGVQFFLNTAVMNFEQVGNQRRIHKLVTNRGICTAGVVINAAGIWADWIAGLAGDRFFTLHGRKGVDAILDINTGQYQHRIAAMPHLLGKKKENTKGGGIVPTIEGNILIGPTAREVPGRENYETDPEDLEELFTRFEVNPKLNASQVITYFAGIRACSWDEDFIIRMSPRVQNLLHLAGIQSPGLASAPAIAADAVQLCLRVLQTELEIRRKSDFIATRERPVKLSELEPEQRDRLIARDSSYGRIVCRCEEISEGEIRDALRRPVPAASMDGIKRRTRAGTGRCHGGFCTPRVLEVMAKELNIPIEQLTKRGGESTLLLRETKQTGVRHAG